MSINNLWSLCWKELLCKHGSSLDSEKALGAFIEKKKKYNLPLEGRKMILVGW